MIFLQYFLLYYNFLINSEINSQKLIDEKIFKKFIW